MDTFMVIARLLHIAAGTFWVGSGVFMLFFVMPTVRSMGPGGQSFLECFYQITPFAIAMPIASLVTTVAGALLYYRVSDHFNADWMSATPGVVLTIASVLGIAAFLHGATVTGPTSDKLGKLTKDLGALTGPPSESKIAEVRGLQQKLGQHARISTTLEVLSLLGMAAARYA